VQKVKTSRGRGRGRGRTQDSGSLKIKADPTSYLLPLTSCLQPTLQPSNPPIHCRILLIPLTRISYTHSLSPSIIKSCPKGQLVSNAVPSFVANRFVAYFAHCLVLPKRSLDCLIPPNAKRNDLRILCSLIHCIHIIFTTTTTTTFAEFL
jgi:hypothetical protein